MKRARAVRTLALSLGLAGVATGCSQHYYYNKPDGTYSEFFADHETCVRKVGIPSADAEHALVSPSLYQGCMKARGWNRAKQTEPAPADWFRGIEDRDIVTIGSGPPARPQSILEPTGEQLVEHCRQRHLVRPDWRYQLEAYRACLQRR